ncbi:Uncharacterised protein [Mycobacteroides abscessus subsp. abscessus]|nr:Uncharacterised protein [Mycobacteroides abscessus subsp. abscessus]
MWTTSSSSPRNQPLGSDRRAIFFQVDESWANKPPVL